MRVLILGINGFIGHSLVQTLLANTAWEVVGMDLVPSRLGAFMGHPRFAFVEGDIREHDDWVADQVRRADAVLPLAARAKPLDYVREPLAVFELDFEANLKVVRHCMAHGRRLVFPSTSEVYGMCGDHPFDEEKSPLTLGPVQRQRWIYSCSKQLLERVIWAYGAQGLDFTVFRPFNWFGPNLDRIERPERGSSRVVTQLLGHLLRGESLPLVDGGHQRRCFTYVDDGTDALVRILRNDGGRASGRIFNLGNPANECSVRDLANHLIDVVAQFPGCERLAAAAVTEQISGADYYGEGYEDLGRRSPDVTAAGASLGWVPRVGLRRGLERTVAHYLAAQASGEWDSCA